MIIVIFTVLLAIVGYAGLTMGDDSLFYACGSILACGWVILILIGLISYVFDNRR